MIVRELAVAGYRSLRKLELPLCPVNVVVGPNGSGKSNLYRCMVLLAAAAAGQLARALADEGGMPSALWAGARKAGPVRMVLGVTVDDLIYEIQCGLPAPTAGAGRDEPTLFGRDPEVKEERLWLRDDRFGQEPRRVAMLERNGGSAWLRDHEGRRQTYPLTLSEYESALSALRDPAAYPELAALRQAFLEWRFYHQFRTDAASPIREPQVGVRTPVLDPEGRSLAAALQTIKEIGDRPALEEAVARAFDGAALSIEEAQGMFTLGLVTPGFKRPFTARELSDGTLQYLCLLAALLSPRPPALLALNEPEASIHPDLLDPLADLIAQASRRARLWITTHSERLAARIAERTGHRPIRLEKVNGETRLAGDERCCT